MVSVAVPATRSPWPPCTEGKHAKRSDRALEELSGKKQKARTHPGSDVAKHLASIEIGNAANADVKPAAVVCFVVEHVAAFENGYAGDA